MVVTHSRRPPRTLLIRCPECATLFRCPSAALAQAGGIVQCGICRQSFKVQQAVVGETEMDPGDGSAEIPPDVLREKRGVPSAGTEAAKVPSPTAAAPLEGMGAEGLEAIRRFGGIVTMARSAAGFLAKYRLPDHTGNAGGPMARRVVGFLAKWLRLATQRVRPADVAPASLSIPPSIPPTDASTGGTPGGVTPLIPGVRPPPPPRPDPSPGPPALGPARTQDVLSVADAPLAEEPAPGAVADSGMDAGDRAMPGALADSGMNAGERTTPGAHTERFRVEDEDIPAALAADWQRAAKQPPHPAIARAWRVGASSLALVLAGQILWDQRVALYALLAWPPLHPALEALCKPLGCTPPMLRDVKSVEFVSRTVVEHPLYKEALLVQGTIHSKARFPQPFPQLELVLFDAGGHVIGLRRFQPNEYLGPSVDAEAGMQPSVLAPVVLELSGDPDRATSFEFKFLSSMVSE